MVKLKLVKDGRMIYAKYITRVYNKDCRDYIDGFSTSFKDVDEEIEFYNLLMKKGLTEPKITAIFEHDECFDFTLTLPELKRFKLWDEENEFVVNDNESKLIARAYDLEIM